MDSRMKSLTITSLALVATLVAGAEAQCQATSSRLAAPAKRSANEPTRGLMLGLHTLAAQGVTLSGGDFDEPYEMNSGFGAGVTIGYGFNRTFTSYVSFDVAKQRTKEQEAIEGTYGLGHLEFGVRANLPLGWASTTVPYVLGSMGRRALSARATDYETGESADVSFHGSMFGLGAGIERFISPNMSLDAGVHMSFGKFDHITFDGEDDSLASNGTTNLRLRFGVTWRPRI